MGSNKTETAEAKVRVDSSQAVKSIKDLRRNVRKLKSDWNKAEIGSKEYIKATRKLRTANAALAKHNASLRQTSRTWDTIKASMVGTLSGNLAAAGVSTIVGYAREAVNFMGTLSDAQSDVVKTTGLTEVQMGKLNKELSKIDTRTGRMQLLALAKEAGRLGKSSVADIAKFVKESDKIKVALGEDLGDNAVTQINKISGVFGVGALNIGSAINEIGQSGAAFEGYQAEFLARTAASAKATGFFADEVLGFSAVLDENAVKLEMSATALGGFFVRFEKDLDKFGKVAGYAKGELRAIKDEMGNNEAFIQFLTTLKETSATQEDFLKKLEAIGVTGDRKTAVFLTLAQNIDKIREKQALANKAMQEGTSITDEFNKKNNNLAANLEKAGKKLRKAFINSPVFEGLQKMVSATADFIVSIKGVSAELEENTNKLLENKAQVDNLEKEILPLLTRYDELKDKAKLNKEEQIELNDIIKSLKQSLPLTAMEFDKFGTVIGVNTKKSKEYIKQLNEINKLQTKGQRQELAQQAYGNLINLKHSQRVLKILSNRKTPKGARQRQLFAAGLKEAVDNVKRLKTETQGYLLQIEQLGGSIDETFEVKQFFDGLGILPKVKADLNAIAKEVDFVNSKINEIPDKGEVKTSDKNEDNTGGGSIFQTDAEKAEIEKQRKKNEKRLQLQKDFYQLLTAEQKKLYNSTLSQYEQEIIAIQDKYEKHRKVAIETFTDINQQKEALALIGELETTELFVKNEEHRAKIATDFFDKNFAKAKEDAEKREELQKQITQAIDEATKTSSEIEIEETEARFVKLLTLATEYGIDVVDLEKAKLLALKKLRDAAADEEADKADDAALKRAKQFQKDIELLTGYASQVVDIGNSIANINAANEQNELQNFRKSIDTKIAKLDEQREQGIITQKQYESQKERLQQDFAKREADMKREQFLRQQQADIAQSIINTALTVSRALATPPSPNIFAAGIALALGAVQTTAIASQPVPKFFKGGNIPAFSGDTPGGKYQGKIVEVHGGEYVVDNASMQNPAVFNFTRAIEAMKAGNSFFNGGYISTAAGANANPATNINTTATSSDPLLISTLQEQNKLLKQLLSDGIKATAVYDDDDVVKIRDKIDTFDKIDQLSEIK